MLDDADRRLIAALRTDARTPVSSLAARLGLSRATVKARIDRLVERGVIQGFTVTVRSDAGEPALRAISMIEIEGRSADKVAQRLNGLPQVRRIHTTNGRWDLVAEIEVASLEEFDAVLREIRHLDGVANSETSLLLSTRKG